MDRSVDTVLNVVHKIENATIGHSSPYATIPHLGTNNNIDGWKWDKRYWPTEEELGSIALAPSIWDASTSRLAETYFQSGYGDNNDLLLLNVEHLSTSGIDKWAPKIHHGYYYSHDDEWYLYGDSYQTEVFQLDMAISGQQHLTLGYPNRPTDPISLNMYSFDPLTGRHSIDTAFRKVLEFTSSGTSE